MYPNHLVLHEHLEELASSPMCPDIIGLGQHIQALAYFPMCPNPHCPGGVS